METTINSRVLNRKLTFFAPDTGGYTYVDLNESEGTLGVQICMRGQFRGPTLSAYSESELSRLARRWYRAFIKNLSRS